MFIINLSNSNINMCHFDNLVKLISLEKDCMFYVIFDVRKVMSITFSEMPLVFES